MSIKKMLMLASAVAVLVAFAAPAAAQADWTWDEEGGIHLEGEVATNVVGSPVTIGPCEVTFEGTAYNVDGVAHGDIEGGNVTTPCNISPLPGCQLEAVDLGNFPWTVTFNTATETEVAIHDATLTKTFNSTCQNVYGLPPAISVGGTITGDVEGQCIVFNKDGDLKLHGSGAPVAINGEVCLTEGGPTVHG